MACFKYIRVMLFLSRKTCLSFTLTQLRSDVSCLEGSYFDSVAIVAFSIFNEFRLNWPVNPSFQCVFFFCLGEGGEERI